MIIVMEIVSRSASCNPINILRSGLAGRCILVFFSLSRHGSLLDKENRRLQWSTHGKDNKIRCGEASHSQLIPRKKVTRIKGCMALVPVADSDTHGALTAITNWHDGCQSCHWLCHCSWVCVLLIIKIRRTIILRKRFKVDDHQWYTVSENEPYIYIIYIYIWLIIYIYIYIYIYMAHSLKLCTTDGHPL